MQTAVSSSLVGQVVARVSRLYGSRLLGVYLCDEPLFDIDEGADVDFLVVLAGEVNVYREIGVLSGPASELGLEHDLVLSLYPVSQDDFAVPRSGYISSAKASSRKVA
jgi:hypothetical protein